VTVADQESVHLPLGLLGFEDQKRYVLLANPDEAPFMWLQMLDDPTRAFLVIAASALPGDYRPELSPEDVEFLGLPGPQDALVLNIVTLRGQGEATVNLKGPIVLNRQTLVGRQVIPVNAGKFPTQHPLRTAP
jgi:flagellar assembly factor FliW